MQNLPFLEFLQTLGRGIPCTKLIKAINPQTKTINNENIYDLDAITSKLNVNIIINKDENNKLQGSNKDDIIISSKTNEDLVGNGGNDVYVFSKDWGKDIVYSYHNNKQSISLRFNDIKLNEIELSTNKNNDLIITDIANSNNEIFIQNALYDGEYKIDKIIVEEVRPEGGYGVGNQKTHKALM